jgi:hypothetical protein
MKSESIGQDRRALLLAGLAGAGVLAAKPVMALSSDLNLTGPKERLRVYLLMRGALDDRLVTGFVNGRYYGVVDDEITPLYGVAGATFSRYRANASGGYDGISYELAFFTDLTTGLALDEFLNPYTGQTVKVPVTFLGPSPFLITADCDVVSPHAPASVQVSDKVVSARTALEDVWLSEETKAAMTFVPGSKPVRYSEMLSLHARASDLLRPDVRQVGSETGYTSVVTWRPWLNMAGHPGHLLGVGAGRYGAAMAALPEAWRAAAAVHRPDILKNPGALLDSFGHGGGGSTP